ncbi:MAG: hypothetical protein ABL869_08440 [Candidatus Nitrotoga sp.]
MKTPRHVNTRAKAAMMVAVARHIAYVPMSRAYYDKKRAEGKLAQLGDSSLGQASCASHFGLWLNRGENTKYDKSSHHMGED